MNKEYLYITTIAEYLSISKAADKLYISQPSLSHYLSTVEDRIGVQLFIRSTKGLKLTFAGEEYCRMAHEILKIYSDFENGLTELNKLKKGRIRIGITNYLGVLQLVDILPNFHRMYPHIELEIHEYNSATLETLLADNKIDFALMHTTNKKANPNIEITHLSKEPFVVVAESNSSLSKFAIHRDGDIYPTIPPEYLRNAKFIMLKRGQMIRKITNDILSHADIKPNILLETINFETARRLACSGMGITFSPLSYCSIYSAEYKGDYYLLPPEFDVYWFMSIVTPANTHLSLATRELIDFFTNRLSI